MVVVDFRAPDVRHRAATVWKRHRGLRPYGRHYYSLGNGLNFVATICPNEACESRACVCFDPRSNSMIPRQWIAHNVKFQDQQGRDTPYGFFNYEEDRDDIRCPCCQITFQPTHIVFLLCSARVDYHMADEAHPEHFSFTLPPAGDKRIKFGHDGALPNYIDLKIDVKACGEYDMDNMDDIVQQLGALTMNNNAQQNDVGQPNYINPQHIRYTRNRLTRFFQDGRSVRHTMRMLRGDLVTVQEIPTINVFRHGDLIKTEDIRRLWCFKMAGVPMVPVNWIDIEDVDVDQFTGNGVHVDFDN